MVTLIFWFLVMSVVVGTLLIMRRTRAYTAAWLPVVGAAGLTVVLFRLHREILTILAPGAVNQALDGYPLIVLIVVSQLVLLLVVINYLRDLQRVSTGSTNRGIGWATVLACVSLVASGVFAAITGLLWVRATGSEAIVHSLVHANEFVSIGTFVLWVLLDFLVYRAAAAQSTPGAAEVRSLSWNALWMVDAPCLFGCIMVAVLHWLLDMMGPSLELLSQGFSVGAIAFHVFVTQFNFAYLKTRSHSSAAAAVPVIPE